MRSFYLADAGSAARSTRILGGTVASSWTLTLPTAVGTIGQFLIDSTGAGASAWRYPEKTTSKTTTYTGTGDETTILCDATGGSFTVTLPAAASFTGKHYYIKKTDSSSNVVTIDGNSSETIDGILTRKLGSRYDALKIVSDGSNWHVLSDDVFIGAKYVLTIDQSLTVAAPADFHAVTYDPLSLVTTGAAWKFTAPIADYYSVKLTSLTSSANSTWTLYKNGSADTTIVNTDASRYVSGSTTIKLAATDYIDLRASGHDETDASVSIERVR